MCSSEPLKQAVSLAHLERYLPDRFKEWLRFNIPDRAADFGNHYIGVSLLANSVNESLDFVSDVRNYLNSVSEIFAAAFFVQNVPIDLACGKIGKLIQVFVNKCPRSRSVSAPSAVTNTSPCW